MKSGAHRPALVWRFSLGSMLILALGMLFLGIWVSWALEQGILHATGTANSLYMEALIEPLLPELAQAQGLSEASAAVLDRHFHRSALMEQVLDFRIWGPNGHILYDSAAPITGRVFSVKQSQTDAWAGKIGSNIETLGDEDPSGSSPIVAHVLETYTPIRDGNSGRVVAVTELYQSGDELRQMVKATQASSWLVLAAIMLMMYLLLIGYVRRAGRTITVQQSALSTQVTRLQELLLQNQELAERVRHSAERRSEITERYLRRISAELHDGPAQNISLALLCCDKSCIGLDAGNGQGIASHGVARNGVIAHEALQRSLLELRAISSGLGVPDLERLTPGETAQSVVASHEKRTRTKVTLSLTELPEQAPLIAKLTLYRVIQEALNNAYRYAGGQGQTVDIKGSPGTLELQISDAGLGFDAHRPLDSTTHLGIVGMRERVHSIGGSFVLDSTPGRGTHIVAHLPLTMEEELGDG